MHQHQKHSNKFTDWLVWSKEELSIALNHRDKGAQFWFHLSVAKEMNLTYSRFTSCIQAYPSIKLFWPKNLRSCASPNKASSSMVAMLPVGALAQVGFEQEKSTWNCSFQKSILFVFFPIWIVGYVWPSLITLGLLDFIILPIENWWKLALSSWWQSSWRLVSHDVPFLIPSSMPPPMASGHQTPLGVSGYGYSMLFCISFPFCPTSVCCCKYSRNPTSRKVNHKIPGSLFAYVTYINI